MPIVGGILRDGTKVPTEELLKGYPEVGFPASYLVEVLKDRGWDGAPHVTELLTGTREAYLKHVSKYFIDLDQMVLAMAGTRFHANLEKALPLSELGIKLNGVQGTLDLLEVLPDELNIVDYKLVGSFKLTKWFGIVRRPVPVFDEIGNPVYFKTGARKGQQKTKNEVFVEDDEKEQFDYTMQTNIYRIAINELLANEEWQKANPNQKHLFNRKVDNCKIFFALRDGAISHDFSYNSYYETCEKLDDKVVLDFIKEKAGALKDAMASWASAIESGEDRRQAALDNCPEMCSASETWNGRKCEKYCNVREACKAMLNLSTKE